jgi:hypothetical protein
MKLFQFEVLRVQFFLIFSMVFQFMLKLNITWFQISMPVLSVWSLVFPDYIMNMSKYHKDEPQIIRPYSNNKNHLHQKEM